MMMMLHRGSAFLLNFTDATEVSFALFAFDAARFCNQHQRRCLAKNLFTSLVVATSRAKFRLFTVKYTDKNTRATVWYEASIS